MDETRGKFKGSFRNYVNKEGGHNRLLTIQGVTSREDCIHVNALLIS